MARDGHRFRWLVHWWRQSRRQRRVFAVFECGAVIGVNSNSMPDASAILNSEYMAHASAVAPLWSRSKRILAAHALSASALASDGWMFTSLKYFEPFQGSSMDFIR
jgi:hypothetical protein